MPTLITAAPIRVPRTHAPSWAAVPVGLRMRTGRHPAGRRRPGPRLGGVS